MFSRASLPACCLTLTLLLPLNVIAQSVDLGNVLFANGDNGTPDVTGVSLTRVGQMSISGGMQQSALQPGVTNKIYFANQNGIIEQFTVNQGGSLVDDGGFLMDVSSAIGGAFGNNNVGASNGVRGIAFHPDFNNSGTAGYGKFYTMHTESFGGSNPTYTLDDLPTGSSSTGLGQSDSVLYEWEFDPLGAGIGNGNGDIVSSRQVYRVQYPFGHHNGQNIGFNPTAKPGDADYGNLYMTFGDSGGTIPGSDNFSNDPVTTTAPQDTGNVLGKIVRINPLQSGANAFTIPNDNPFVGNASVQDDIFAIGFRNPQTLSFDTVTGNLLVGDIGHNNVEEINLIEAGGNYGWSNIEGTYEFGTPFDSSTLTEIDLATRMSDPFTYAVAQFDHMDPGGEAIVGGFVYHGSEAEELEGWYIFGDLADDNLYIVSTADLVNDGSPGNIYYLPLEDENGDPISMGEVIGVGAGGRSNIRFAQDAFGDLYIISKQNGSIWRFTGTAAIPEPGSAIVLSLGSMLMLRRRRA